MNADQYDDMIRYAEALWPGTRNYSRAKDRRIVARFININHQHAIAAIDALASTNPEHAPRILEIEARATTLQHEGEAGDPMNTSCDVRGRHGATAVFMGADAYTFDPAGKRKYLPNGMRLGICVDCKTEWIKPAAHLQTVGEAEEARRAAPPEPPSSFADRIAP